MTFRRFAFLVLLLLASACSDSQSSRQASSSVLPTAPSANQAEAPAEAPGGVASTRVPLLLPPESVNFPPRDEPYQFRQDLEVKYRDGLRRSPTKTYVDIEGAIVWTQEYLRYRLSNCSHEMAMAYVLSQINGGGIAPDCGGSVGFPPRNEPYDFRANRLEATYRDVLQRSQVSTYVDIEGDIVWTQEYLRYRVNNCSHEEGVQKVFMQIDGFGIQPVCTGQPSPPAGTAYVRFTTNATTCACWVGEITLYIDGSTVGAMSCTGTSAIFSTTPGTHNFDACDLTGCYRYTATIAANQTLTVPLWCGSSLGLSMKKIMR